MSTQTNIGKSTLEANAQVTRIDTYVRKQLHRTSHQIRLSDLITGLLVLLGFVLGYLMLASVIDAWIWPLSLWGRRLAFCGLLVGTLAIAWIFLIPLLFRKINPQYAAKMIEEAKPSFKNSLLNYLSLRKEKSSVHRAVLNEVSKRAATELSTVSPDEAVDKSNLIKAGFALVGLMFLAIIYTMFSPKSPFPTIVRVLAPGAKVAKPAAVRIQEITPGDTTVFFGERLTVAAKIYGVRNNDQVRLLFSSRDAQIVDAVLPMEFSDQEGQYMAILGGGANGIQQPLTYYIAAGDGLSPVFSVDVRPNPSIAINTIKITPPKYTRLPERVIEGHGDFQAVEGAHVEIQATANLPMELAYIVPMVAKDNGPDSTEYRELRTINMKVDDRLAIGRFVALLNSNREKPQFTHYKINFRSTGQHPNENADIFPIRVIADLPPEIEIIQPAKKEIAIPANQPTTISAWAADLDYEISDIRLHIDHQGAVILNRPFPLDLSQQNAGQRMQSSMTFIPAELGLKTGDRVVMYATAADNRVSPTSELHDPNVSRTENYTMIITPAVDDPIPPPTPQDDHQQARDQAPPKQTPDETTGQPDSPNDEANGDSKTDETKPTGSDSDEAAPEQGDAQPPQSNDPSSDTQEPGNDQPNENPSSTDQGSEPQTDPDRQSEQQQGSSSSDQSASDSASPSDDSSDSDSSSQDPADNEQRSSNDSDSRSSTSSPTTASHDSESQQTSRPGPEGGLENGTDDQSADHSANHTAGTDRGATERKGASQSDQDSANQNGDSDQDESRDQSLADGEPEPLRENASDSEKFEQLKRYFDRQEKEADTRPGQQTSRSSAEREPDQQQDDLRSNNPNRPEQNNEQNNDHESDQRREDEGRSDPTQSDESMRLSSENQSSTESKTSDPGSQPQQDVQRPDDSDSSASDNGSDATVDPNRDQQTPSSSGDQFADGEQSPAASPPGSEDVSSPSDESPSSNDGGSTAPPTDSKPSKGDLDSNSNLHNDSDSVKSDQSNSTRAPSSEGESTNSQPSTEESSDARSEEETSTPQGDSGGPENNAARPADSRDPNQGGSGGTQTKKSPPDSTPPNPDQANLEYTKKVTDLILDRLHDQKYDPEPSLLEQMNWNQHDLDQFLKQWQEMKQNAEVGDNTAKQVYEDALRSLGLSPKTAGRQVQSKKDDVVGLREESAVDQVPREYLEKFNSFLKRRNRSQR